MDYPNQNREARDRILALTANLTDAELARPLEGGWTVGAELAHLAFWDRVHIGRLRAALESGGDLPAPFPAGAPDAINNAGLPGWRAIPGPTARREFEEASAEVDAFLAALDEATAERIRASGLGRNLERFRHRGEHAEAIEAGLRR